MDLLGFFKERNDFLEIKIRFALKNPRPHRIARLASRLSRLWSPGIRPMEKASSLAKPPLRGLYP
jgi:hypothetical protein